MAQPNFTPLSLSANIQSIEFISDLHLDVHHLDTFQAWHSYMQNSSADAIFILGDLFESWIGDDIFNAPPPFGDFERQCAKIIQEASQKSAIYVMQGNRDFLINAGFAKTTQTTLLADPTLLDWDGKKVLLTHGDLLCTDDIPYQEYRAMVHTPQWQEPALAMPIEQRLALAEHMRQKSKEATQNQVTEIMDVNAQTVEQWMQGGAAKYIIHGHTHRPAEHALNAGATRIVLTDWNLETQTHKRAEVLRWVKGQQPERISLI